MKSKKADLENKRSVFLQMGFIFALSVVLAAFEWTSETTLSKFEYNNTEYIMDEIVPITKQEKPEPPAPKPLAFTMLNIVSNDVDPIDDIIIDVESNEKTQIQEYVFTLDDEKEKGDPFEIFTVVEEQPEFPGGYIAMQRYLANNIVYPEMAREIGISGTVYISFVVSPDGSITNVKLERGIGGDCDEESLRVVHGMPKWKPGKQRGKAVYVKFNLPISFNLR